MPVIRYDQVMRIGRLIGLFSNLLAMVSNLRAMAPMASNLEAMASNLIAIGLFYPQISLRGDAIY